MHVRYLCHSSRLFFAFFSTRCLPAREKAGSTTKYLNAWTKERSVSALVRKSRHTTNIDARQFLLFFPLFSCSDAATPPIGAAKRRESRRPIILRLVLFCCARIGEINEPIHYNLLLHTKLFLLLLTSLLPLFSPVFTTTISSTSGKFPADCNVVGSSAGDVWLQMWAT